MKRICVLLSFVQGLPSFNGMLPGHKNEKQSKYSISPNSPMTFASASLFCSTSPVAFFSFFLLLRSFFTFSTLTVYPLPHRDTWAPAKLFTIFSQVAWLRVESKTILTIHHHVITRNYRIGLSHSDDRHWNLHINDVQESDRGGYMCKLFPIILPLNCSIIVCKPAGQINTVPMKYQVGYLDVVGKLIWSIIHLQVE